PQGWMIYVIVTLASLGGIAQPACQAIVTSSVEPTQQGTVQGALTSMASVAGVIAPLIGGGVFAHFNAEGAPMHLPGASFFVSGGLALVGLVVAAWALRRWPAPERVSHPHGTEPPASESAPA
ncbi:MAG TPA: MFS transporter, partial [Phycisphaerales bacterium]|nr:MFS transporter [Phycisphaerales bacterium]